MIVRPGDRLRSVLFVFYALFVFTSTFSIALAQISLVISLVLFIAVAVIEKYQPFKGRLKYFYLSAGLYVLWLIVSSSVTESPMSSLGMIREEWLFLAIPAGVYLFGRKEYRDRLIIVLTISVGLLSLYGLLQYVTGVQWFRPTPLGEIEGFGFRVQGNFSTRLTYANYFGVAALFLAALALFKGRLHSIRFRNTVLLVAAMAAVAAALTFSRGITVACAISVLLLGMVFGRKYILGTLALVAVLALTFAAVPGVSQRFSEGMTNDLDADYEGSRLFIWKHSMAMIAENPLFGVGPGNFHETYKARLRKDIPPSRQLTHAHNDPLNVAAVSGLPGALFFETMWLVVLVYFWRGFRDRRRSIEQRRLCLAALAGSVVFWMGSMIEATFSDEEVRQLLMIVWAAGLSVWYKDSKVDSEVRTVD